MVSANCKALTLAQNAFIEEIVIYGVYCVIKATFLLFYLRLSPDQSFRRCVYLGFALNSVVFVASL